MTDEKLAVRYKAAPGQILVIACPLSFFELPGLSCHSWSLRFLTLLVALVSIVTAAQSQSPSRITQAVDEANLTPLKGNTYPLARSEFDLGLAPPHLVLARMLLVLRRAPEQESALKRILDGQQTRSSSQYHAWLTPEQFGQRFGPAGHDIQTIKEWLGSHGFQINSVAKSGGIIEFSGTAGQLEQAFHTEIHKYEVNGKEHWANSTDPQIPSALTPVIAGIVSIHNFPRKPLYRTAVFPSPLKDTRDRPLLSGGGGCGLDIGTCYAVTPYDLATIYNILPLWNATSPLDGTGQTIAIVAQSDVYPQDFSDFRSDLGLPAGTLNLIYNGTHPNKLATEGDEEESDLDMEWSGAVATGATIDLVISASTNSSAGVDLSALYIVDNDLAPVMSESYSACELDLGTAGNQFYYQLWQQAAAEGITVFVAAGDSGSALCDTDSSIATQGLSVNGVASTPYNVAVGGTDFNDLQSPSTYWNSTNNPVTQASAKSYIPEMTWNDTCTNSEIFQFTGQTSAENDCNDSSSAYWPSFLAPVGGSGGASNCITSTNPSTCAGGYPKPSWQTGVGVPDDHARDVPDISLFAASGLNASSYLVCETDIYGGCFNGVSGLVPVGGTSVSAPAFAGIMAIVNQKTQSRQGAANYVLYPLAAQPGATCPSASNPGSSCIFYDVTAGTIAMPCQTGSPDCVTNVSGDQTGVLSGYSATTGYDLATGLGSVNVANLVNNWGNVSFQPTVATLSLSPTTSITHGTSVNLNITVSPETGSGTPTGLVSLLTSTGKEAGTFTLASGSVSSATDLLPGGSYTVTAHYAGDGTYGATDSTPGVPVTVNAEPSMTVLQAFTLSQNGNSTPFSTGPYGGSIVFLRTNVAGQSGEGTPTGAVNLNQTLNGTTTKLAGDPYSLNNEGYTMTPLPGNYYVFPTPGTYSFEASYGGDASFNSSSSLPATFTIAKAQTTSTTNISGCNSPNPPCIVSPNSLVIIFGTVQSNTPCTGGCGGAAVNLPTGTMTFYSNGVQLGSAAVDSSIIPPSASFSTNQLPAGQYNITAQYSGDTNYSGSTSAATLLAVVIPTELGLTASSTTIHAGQSVTFTAQVGSVQSSGPALTGTVTFTANSTPLGNPVSLASSGLAQMTTTALPLGSVQIAASYSGNVDYSTSAATLTETVSGTPTFTITANPIVVNVPSPGQSGSITLTFTAQSGFTGSATLSSATCANLPPESTCNFNPSTISLSSSTTTVPVIFTVATTASSLVVSPARRFTPGPLPGSRQILIVCLVSLYLVLLFRLRQRRWVAITVFVALAVIASAALGCGGGSGGGGGVGNPGTPAGNYMGVTVTTTINGVTQSINNLIVDVK